MKRVLTSILASAAILLAVSSCSTVPKGPLEPGEMRLLGLDVPDNGTLKLNVDYYITIKYEADSKPEIRRICFTWSGDGPYCLRPTKLKYSSETGIEVPIKARPDVSRLECYVEYVREGKVRRTNTVTSYVTGVN
ncbi:MAG TPA: hypothetical protein VMV04_19860 [Thermodesulfobacteriota bacterium]|nr:hypothetical protein [Thermodesulfobacteriota bacterium]